MVWGVSTDFNSQAFILKLIYHQWLVASIFILFVGMSMAELASAAPTSGGVRRPSPYSWLLTDKVV